MRFEIPYFENSLILDELKSKNSSIKKIHIESNINKFVLFLILILVYGNSDKQLLAQSNKEIIATVNEKRITLADIEPFIPPNYLISEQQQLYLIYKVVLDNYILKIVLENEANQRKLSVENLRKIMTSGNVDIPNETVEREYSANAPYFGLMSPDEAKERIRLDLENEARMQLYRKALSEVKNKAKIVIHLKEDPLLESNVIRNLQIYKGPESAKVIIIEYADFRCFYCRESQETLRKLLVEFKDDVKLVFKHLPLQTTLQSLMPAMAAYCAEDQNRFWELHDILFSSNDLSLTSIKQMAKSLNLDTAKFESCLSSQRIRFTVLKDLKEATRLGITGTPTFVINGKIFPGKQSFSKFKEIIETELRLQKSRTTK